MRVFKIIGVAFAAILIVLVAVAYALPAHYSVVRSMEIGAPPSKIFPLVADPRAWQRWSAWNGRDPAMEIVYSGPARGVGAQWTWRSRSEGDGEMKFTSVDEDRRIDYSLYFPGFDSRAAGTIVLEPLSPTSTRVTWSNEGELGNNPFMRWMGLAMDRMVGDDFTTGLANLKALVVR